MAIPLENIIRYLENEMSATERADFEAMVQKDGALAKEVEFQRRLHGFLERRQPKLESRLSSLGDKYILKQKKNHKWNWILFVLFLLALLILCILSFPKKASISPPTNEIEIDSQQVLESDSLKKDLKQPLEQQPPIKRKKKIKTPPKAPSKRPIAELKKADYQLNLLMEDLIENQYRNLEKQDTFILTSPASDTVFKQKETVPFSLKGSTNIAPPYQLIIYSNQNADIENDVRILNRELVGNLFQNQYQIDFTTNLSLDKGLYYLIIQKEDARRMVHISRFKVE